MIPDKIPPVLTSKEIIEKSFRNINKIQDIYKPNFVDKVKIVSIQKIQIMEATSRRILNRIYKGFPKIDDLDNFERDMLYILINAREYDRSLNNIKWSTRKISEFATNAIRGIKKARDEKVVARFRSSFYGRFSSVIENLDESLSILKEAREEIRKIPFINKQEKVIIITGFPNVGKSLLISRLTNLKPEVAEYPFTTKDINVGVLTFNNRRYQVLDVPGILNRNKSNQIEKKALAAIENVGDILIYLFDPTEQCGFSLKEQEALYQELVKQNKKVIAVDNKADIMKMNNDHIKVSALTEEGLDLLLKSIEEEIK